MYEFWSWIFHFEDRNNAIKNRFEPILAKWIRPHKSMQTKTGGPNATQVLSFALNLNFSISAHLPKRCRLSISGEVLDEPSRRKFTGCHSTEK